jgi:hypothetical protein
MPPSSPSAPIQAAAAAAAENKLKRGGGEGGGGYLTNDNTTPEGDGRAARRAPGRRAARLQRLGE